jgi:hypothetical protein
MAGLIREVLQNWGDPNEENDAVDSNFDSMGFLVGAFVAAIAMSFVS